MHLYMHLLVLTRVAAPRIPLLMVVNLLYIPS